MDIEEIKLKLENALINLYLKDNYLLSNGSSERSIAHRLAIHLEFIFSKYDVDCEYNIDINVKNESKEIHLPIEKMQEFEKKIANRKITDFENEDYYSVSVFPDIIVHKRGNSDFNLLICELKKNTSSIDEEYDMIKLERYTSNNFPKSLKYEYGVFVIIHIGLKDSYKFEISIFKNSKEIENFCLSGQSK